jgi:hypothetical protein
VHNIKHYGAFGEDYLGYSDPTKDLRKAVKQARCSLEPFVFLYVNFFRLHLERKGGEKGQEGQQEAQG